MRAELSLQQIMASLEARIAFYREREAAAARQEAVFRPASRSGPPRSPRRSTGATGRGCGGRCRSGWSRSSCARCSTPAACAPSARGGRTTRRCTQSLKSA